MKYTAVSVRQLERRGKPWQARAKYKDVKAVRDKFCEIFFPQFVEKTGKKGFFDLVDEL